MRKQCLLLFVLAFFSLAAKAQNSSWYARVGSADDAVTRPIGGIMLMGGGKDLPAAFQWMCERSGGGDFLVLRAAGNDAYNSYVRDLCLVNSVATLIVPSREAANEPTVVEAIRNAEAIFIAAGDQANYINFWKDTPVQDAINDAVARGVPIGGSSAGLAILGEISFARVHGNTFSRLALTDPFDKTVALERDFLHVPPLKGIITETDFVTRDHLGRLLAFMARIVRDGWSPSARAIAVDERTAVAIEPDGWSSVMGAGAAYFYRSTRLPTQCEPGYPLRFPGVSVYKALAHGATFNLASWTGSGGTSYTLSVFDGLVKSTQPGGSLY